MADAPDTKTETHDIPGGQETTKTTHSEDGSATVDTKEVVTESTSG